MYLALFLYIFSFLLSLFALYLIIRYAKIRGYYGEKWVKEELLKLPKDDYTILNDIILKDSYGYHQIDHIVLSRKGIFVIEMKNYYGLIKGYQYNDYWTQGKIKRKFSNPIHQNYGHIMSLVTLLNLPKNYFISIICFSNDSKLRVKTNEIVVNLRDLNKRILNYQHEELNINLGEIEDIILQNNITSKKERRNHIRKIANINKKVK